MSVPLIDVLASLQQKISSFESERRAMLDTIETLNSQILALSNDLKEKEAALTKANRDIEFLRVSYRLAENPNSLIETRRKISGLIRTIETCISMLKE